MAGVRIIFIDFGAENVNGAGSRLVAFLGGNRTKSVCLFRTRKWNESLNAREMVNQTSTYNKESDVSQVLRWRRLTLTMPSVSMRPVPTLISNADHL